MKMGKIKNFKKAALEMDQLGKLIIGLVILIILIIIVSVVIGGKLDDQGSSISKIFNIF